MYELTIIGLTILTLFVILKLSKEEESIFTIFFTYILTAYFKIGDIIGRTTMFLVVVLGFFIGLTSSLIWMYNAILN